MKLKFEAGEHTFRVQLPVTCHKVKSNKNR